MIDGPRQWMEDALDTYHDKHIGGIFILFFDSWIKGIGLQSNRLAMTLIC
jgi:hypothetical protein